MKLINRTMLLFFFSAMLVSVISVAARIQDMISFRSIKERLRFSYMDNIINVSDCVQRRGDVFLIDNTFWDDMVKFVKTGDSSFAHVNIDNGIHLYGIDCISVFDKKFNLVYYKSRLKDKSSTRLPLPVKSLKRLFIDDNIIYFFMRYGNDIFRISGASIHPSADPGRKSPAAGYMITAIRYDSQLLKRVQLENINLRNVTLVMSGENIPPEDKSTVRVTVPLPGINGVPAAFIVADYYSEMLELMSFFEMRRYMITFTTLLILVGVLVIFYRWIIVPTTALYKAMMENSEICPDLIAKAPAEFRFLGSIIRKRMEAEEKLRNANIHKEIEKEKAEKARDATSRFLADMSHELRTPLTCAIGFSEMLGGTALTDEQKVLAEGIHNSSLSVLSIINDVLDISKIDAGRLILAEINFNLHNLVNYAALMMKGFERNKNLNLICRNNLDPLCFVAGDEARIRQILLNLISNAVKYTSSGEVVLTAEEEPAGEGVSLFRFTVSDTGIGMTKEQVEKLFERFVQVHDGEFLSKGTGLGLVITKNIIDQMNGELKVESRQGEGSVFDVSIRLKKCSANVPSSEQDYDTKLNLKILIVEDNKINFRILNNILEKYGCASEHAENGLMALEMLNKNSYDAVMMDCQLPEMDGYDATERIRRGETPDSGIKIIAITADVTEERKNRCLEAGMDCCIGKPFNKNEIYELLVKIKNSRK